MPTNESALGVLSADAGMRIYLWMVMLVVGRLRSGWGSFFCRNTHKFLAAQMFFWARSQA